MIEEITIKEKQSTIKETLIEQAKKTPIVQIACEKAGVSRATFYRWKNKDPFFSEKIEEALFEGRHLINDYAESQLISAIRNGNMTAIIYWLNHNHKNYRNKLEVTGKIKSDGLLTPEQEERIMKALELASLIGNDNQIKKDYD